MFDFSWSELLLIGIVALIFIGPKELPGVLRTLGQWMNKIRRMAGDFQNQFHDAMREAELADLKKEVDEMAAQASHYASIDPLADVRKEMDGAQRDVESAVADAPAPSTAANEPAGAPASEPTSGPANEPAGVPPASPAPAEIAAHPEAPVTAAAEPASEPAKEPVSHGAAHSAAGSGPA